tara:strand:+ start:5973 stop:6491 length:519 start_codon:yes stop_codon:yes gene_type:complete
MLLEEIKQIAERTSNKKETSRFLERLRQESLTRDENEESHFCVYFFPYNPEIKEVFIVHHKKSGKWLAPGGHIDKGEDIVSALNREIQEELGVQNFFPKAGKPFLITITPINNLPIQKCRAHYDLWFLMNTDGKNFAVDPTEFHSTQWISISKAREYIVNQNTLKALQVIES